MSIKAPEKNVGSLERVDLQVESWKSVSWPDNLQNEAVSRQKKSTSKSAFVPSRFRGVEKSHFKNYLGNGDIITKYFYCHWRPFKQPPTTPTITFLRIRCFLYQNWGKGNNLKIQDNPLTSVSLASFPPPFYFISDLRHIEHSSWPMAVNSIGTWHLWEPLSCS